MRIKTSAVGALCLDLVDIVAINYYPGWHFGEIDEVPERLDAVIAQVDADGQGDKPIIISEIGAGGVCGWQDWNEARWTEQYQAKLLEIATGSGARIWRTYGSIWDLQAIVFALTGGLRY